MPSNRWSSHAYKSMEPISNIKLIRRFICIYFFNSRKVLVQSDDPDPTDTVVWAINTAFYEIPDWGEWSVSASRNPRPDYGSSVVHSFHTSDRHSSVRQFANAARQRSGTLQRLALLDAPGGSFHGVYPDRSRFQDKPSGSGVPQHVPAIRPNSGNRVVLGRIRSSLPYNSNKFRLTGCRAIRKRSIAGYC